MACPVTGHWTVPAADLYPDADHITLWSLTDDSLRRVRREHLRAVEDAVEDGDRARARREAYMAEEVRAHQLQRFQLRMRYGAVDDHVGTTSYDCYVRHNEPPAYALAMHMDFHRARLGRSHVLQWPATVAA